MMDLILMAKDSFNSQPMMLECVAPLNICGDIHGQLADLIRLFNLLKYPENFLLLRGNHETPIVNRIYGFYEDLVRRFATPRLYNVFQEVFAVMPLSAVVSDRILCMHGGLSPSLLTAPSLSILNEIRRPIQVRVCLDRTKKTRLTTALFQDPPNPSLPLDLLWADPDINTKQFKYSIRY
ncbi:unnamed protein product [Nippostrongylus brasiliensis]|uniref:Serine/threonine-protein phosphatase n=1 Tax=Nippostrongylus brasiliensis TaxID=27835 RepID=A0A0N4YGL7_NIPBR|nr:unnamed protein product [Nippostrongylus brasiliensis]